ncbi:MAG: SRPBCC family protein [Anaerolineaceae bacterium]
MNKIHKSITIHAPVEKVYKFMTNPNNLLEIWPSMVEVHKVEMKPDGWHRFDWVYKMGGLKFSGWGEATEVRPNQFVQVTNKSGIPSKFDWTYEAMGEDSKITVDAEYTVPVPLINKLAESIIVKMNEKEAEILLANLKTRMEEAEEAKEEKVN